MKHIIILAFLIILSSCNNKSNSSIETSVEVNDSTKITKEDISKINFIEYGIDNKARVTLDSWEAYNIVYRAIEEVKQGDFKFFKTDDQVFITILNDLETTIPEAINSESINARILILRTKLLKFREIINLNTSSKKEKLIGVKELFQSFSYVTLQINKKFEKEAQNIIKPDSL
ncbi:hypothetical protein CLV86_1973 [Lacinutrix venerupis]|uniref:hypothetical protein n=1 Tax=Lacinutrix venerupis TaxID=1486034 RepID=UPI000EAE4979|nr:hypothetical protein [Lacinutrix venerupis]RLJ63432.1 hypothetical protein CLV86_1973 [Lacinutrix venerupis]